MPLLVVLAAAVPAAALPLQSSATTAPAAAQRDTTDDPSVYEGGAIYQLRCAVCHGTSGEGRSGDGVTAGPPLRGLPTAYVDMTLRTGRMPLAYDPAGVPEKRLADAERVRLVEWAAHALALEGEVPEVGPGDAANGQVVYVRHCAACHGATGGGGVAGGGTTVPGLHDADEVAVVEALRVGPFEMPRFGDRVITEAEAEDVAAYVTQVLGSGQTSPLGIAEVGSVLAGVLTAVVSALALAAVAFVAHVGSRKGREE